MGQRPSLREWLAEHAREEAWHYKDIAKALGRDPGSVSASLSIEDKKAQEEQRPPYFERVGPGLYRYNEICEGAIDEDTISEVRKKADTFNMVTRSELNQVIADLSIEAFKELAKIVLLNTRARVEDIEERDQYNNTIVITTSWLDDGGRAPVVFHVKKCELDEEITKETILEIRGSLHTFGSNQGVLISNGIVDASARKEALVPNVSVPPVHIMDKEIMLNILIESRTGIRTKHVEVFLLDKAFFDRLEKRED